ncbi:MAG: hemerythrin domain-containing protein [Pseudomonadota bacterium]
MTHVNETLHHDHENVAALIDKLKGTTGGSEKTRNALCRQIRQALAAHTEFEEKVFYPAVRDATKAAQTEVKAAIEEHQQVDRLLDDIDDMDPTADGFIEAVSELEQAVEKHVRREEEKIFPMAQKAIEAGRADEMSQRHDQMLDQQMR